MTEETKKEHKTESKAEAKPEAKPAEDKPETKKEEAGMFAKGWEWVKENPCTTVGIVVGAGATITVGIVYGPALAARLFVKQTTNI